MINNSDFDDYIDMDSFYPGYNDNPKTNDVLENHKRLISNISCSPLISIIELPLPKKSLKTLIPKDTSIYLNTLTNNNMNNDFSLTGFLFNYINRTMNMKQIRQV
jgi:hypothetical protein